MKILDFEMIRQICRGIEPSVFYDWIDDGLRNKDKFEMPVKSRISQNDGDYFMIMPCMYEAKNLAMVKMIGRHQIRGCEEQRSTMMSDMLVYESDTGVLKALIDGEYITTLRTGAAAAHAAIMYGKSDFSTVGLIGLGNIMTVCMEIFLDKVKDKNITLKLYKHHEQERRMAERFSHYLNVQFQFCDTYEETVSGSDLVFSAVTRATEDFCVDSCYMEGCTVIPIMTLGFQNCDLFFDKVFTDEIEQIRGFKYFDKFKSVSNTTDVLAGKRLGRENDKERILVYYYGLAVHDLYFATKILEKSENLGDMEYRYCKERYFV